TPAPPQQDGIAALGHRQYWHDHHRRGRSRDADALCRGRRGALYREKERPQSGQGKPHSGGLRSIAPVMSRTLPTWKRSDIRWLILEKWRSRRRGFQEVLWPRPV